MDIWDLIIVLHHGSINYKQYLNRQREMEDTHDAVAIVVFPAD
jgi:hypothetical protein